MQNFTKILATATTISTVLTSLCLGITLDNVIQTSLDTNPNVFSKKFARQSGYYQVKKAKSYYYPSARVEGSIGEERADNSSTRAILGGDSRFTTKEGTIFLSQVLFDGGFRSSNLSQSISGYNSTKWQVLSAREEIAFSAAEAYLNVLRARRIVEIYTEDVKVHETILEKIAKRYEGGVGKISDVNLADSRLALAKSQLFAAKETLADSSSRFFEVTGFEPPEEMEIPELPKGLPESTKEAEQLAEMESPFIQDAVAKTDIAKYQIGVSKSAFYPVISLDSTTYRSDQLNGVPGRNFFFNGVITARWNFYNGGKDIAQVKSDKALYERSVSDLESVHRFVNDEIQSGLSAYKIEFNRYIALEAHTALSWEVYQNYGKEFEVGSRSFFDLLNAQVEFFQAQVTETNSFYDHRLIGYRVLAAMGKLSDYFAYNDCN